ncbi:hypothetical protein B0H19DRAFT_1371507 [Mycena capillaripes]|nr:hypothetical protein B0H19DRAFT_1371507 [Mycena capillaripes]
MPQTPKTQRATKQERALLIFTLLNPMHEDACCVLSLRPIFDKVFSKKNPEDDARQAEVLRAAMAFLSATNRSDAEHAVMREHILTCPCKPAIRGFHRPVCRPHTEVLEVVLFVICGTISEYLRRLGPAKFRKSKANVAPEAQPWPSSIADIIPSPGAEHDVLVALVQWATSVPGGHSVFMLIGALARFWEPFASLLFTTPGVFLLATNHMRHALDSYDPDAGPAERMNDFISPILSCAQGLFQTMSDIDMSTMVEITAKIYPEMYAIAEPIEPILARMNVPGLSMDDCRRWFHFVRGMRAVVAPDGTFIKRPQVEVLKNMVPDNHYIGAFMRMVEIRTRNQCLHIACTAPVLGRSSICSRCGIVRFCSRECLTAAWNSPHLPHKSLCKSIQRIRAATLLTDETAWNRIVRDDSHMHRSPIKFADTCVAACVDPQLAQSIWTGINLLLIEKVDYAVRIEQAAAGTEDGGEEQPESDSEAECVGHGPTEIEEEASPTEGRVRDLPHNVN